MTGDINCFKSVVLFWVCLPQNATTCPSKMQHVEWGLGVKQSKKFPIFFLGVVKCQDMSGFPECGVR